MGIFSLAAAEAEMNEVVSRSKRRLGSLAVKSRYHKLPRLLEDDYEVDRLHPLGSGCSGSVYPATATRSGLPFAVKTFRIKGAEGKDLEDIVGEAEMLLMLDHPQVVRLMDCYDSGEELSFVMERMEGGELFDKLQSKSQFTEFEALDATLQMLRAVEYIHTEGIVHRDLKLENFMYDQPVGENRRCFLKLIDFGFSKFVRAGEYLDESLGTAMYVAPEVLARKYAGGSCDMWSLGVIVFTLLCGRMPFVGSELACFRKIKKGRYQMKPEQWVGVSEMAKDFVRRLLVVKPTDRLTATSALRHPWLLSHEEHLPPQADRAIVDAFARFFKAPRMKQTCMKVMAWTLHLDARRNLRDLFIHSSLNKAGVMKIDDLLDLVQNESGLAAEEVETVIHCLRRLDDDGDGELHYSDFLAAMMAAQPQIYDAALHRTFWHFAKKDGQAITPKGLRCLLNKSVDEAEILTFFREADQDRDGKIDAAEFVTYLCDGCPEQARSQVLSEVERFNRLSRCRSRSGSSQTNGCWPKVATWLRGFPFIGRCLR